uniref:Succinate-CoA ligase subunit beta n=1 Tax=Chlamydomonas euryale TaxID=1486919 RepID=A0A7R9VEY7_9CHLO
MKSQILAGGRGLGTFKSGLKGGVHMTTADKAPGLAQQMLGGTLVTKQTGPAGKPVNTLYVAKKMQLAREMYFAILLDRKSAGTVMIGCSEGGTSIEDLAEKHPDKIIKVPVDVREGITDAQANTMAKGLGVTGDMAAAAQQIKNLYELFVKTDCTMVEVNPLAEDKQGRLIAADAKLGFDDNAAFRQKDVFALKDDSQIDPREVAAAKVDLNYIGLDGSIGCMVNGAGLAMATMDIIKLHGGSPANFLDVGGNASEEQVVEAFKILTDDKQVKAILVNIFGGIMRCDVIAAGIVNATRHVGVTVPLVVRLEGTNVEKGREILTTSGLTIITAADLDDAAKKAVGAIKA